MYVTVLLPNRYSNDAATGFEPRVALYLLPYPASGRVALAVTRQGSLRPVRARIRAYGSSADRFATPEGSPWLFGRVLWTCVRTSMCSACFPRSSLPADASLPFTGSSGASSPASSVLSKRYDFLPSIPPHLVAFA